jgi:hypothetical protein
MTYATRWGMTGETKKPPTVSMNRPGAGKQAIGETGAVGSWVQHGHPAILHRHHLSPHNITNLSLTILKSIRTTTWLETGDMERLD